MPKLIDLVGNSEELSITNAALGEVITKYKLERMNYFPPPLNEDSTSVWISKEKVMELLNRNPDSDGIRLYYGIIDDPNVTFGIHNLVLVSTENARQDMVDENDWVIVTKNVGMLFDEGNLNALICPPPIDRCQGRYF